MEAIEGVIGDVDGRGDGDIGMGDFGGGFGFFGDGFMDVFDFIIFGFRDTEDVGEFGDNIHGSEAGEMMIPLEIGRQVGEVKRDTIQEAEHLRTDMLIGFYGGFKLWQNFQRWRGLALPLLSLLIPLRGAPSEEGALGDAGFNRSGGDIATKVVEGFEGGGFFIG